MSNEPPESHSSGQTVALLLVLLIFVLLLPFLVPLGEYIISGSHHVEDYYRRIGVRDTVARIYKPLFDLFK